MMESIGETAVASDAKDALVHQHSLKTAADAKELLKCATCGERQERSYFSARQWNQRHSLNRISLCRACSGRAHRDLDALTKRAAASATNRLASGVRINPQNHGYCNYVDLLFSLDCFPVIASLGLFHSAKDVSESLGALHGVSAFGGLAESSAKAHADSGEAHGGLTSGGIRIGGASTQGVLALAIGDGTRPQTAALASFLTTWHAVSIDPLLEPSWVGPSPHGVQRLCGVRGTLEEYIDSLPPLTTQLENGAPLTHLVLLCVHSHARFVGAAEMGALRARFGHVPTTLVAIPCCATFHPDKDLQCAPTASYEDLCIFSAKRLVSVWTWPQQEKVAHGSTALPLCVPCH